MNIESHITPMIDAYLLGGLDEAEQHAFESHVANCQACATALENARRADSTLHELFADVQPDAQFEDRLVHALATRQPKLGLSQRLSRPILHPAVRRIATGVAAALVIGSVGYGMSRAVDQTKQADAVPANGQAMTGFNNESRGWSGSTELHRSNSGRSIVVQKETAERPLTLLGTRDLSRDGNGREELDVARTYQRDEVQLGQEDERERESLASPDLIKQTARAPMADPKPGKGESNRGRSDLDLFYDNGKSTGGARGNSALAAKSAVNEGTNSPSQPTALGDSVGNPARDYVEIPNFADAPDFNLQSAEKPSSGSGGGGGGGRFTGRESTPPPGYVELKGGTEAAQRTELGLKWNDAKWFKPDDYFSGKTTDTYSKDVDGPVKGQDALLLPEQVTAEKIEGVEGKKLESPAELAKPGDLPAGVTEEEKENTNSSTPPAVTVAQPVQPNAVQPKTIEQQPVQQARKIIRNGTVTFEVDSFDSALMQVTKIAQEEGGFVSTTSSDKLPNGKVKGSLTLRVPPERLDTLVLKLRGLGDLKNQKISADDVTKRYTDIESQLKAARAMEERLLAIIKGGGVVKDLLEAERQLGIWREKLEMLEGEIRYFNNLISLSTLVVELLERDVRTPTAAVETELVNTAVHAEDVETARSEAIKAIEQAKGRIVDSELKKLEAGQLSAKIIARLAPDTAGPVIDRLKQLGKVARLDISRKTTTEGGTGPIVPGLRVEKRETVFEIYIYNLANIEPRQTVSLNLAAADVETTYRTIIDQVMGAGGGIVSSQLSRPKPDQTEGVINFQVPTEKADVLMTAVRSGVDVMRMELVTNTDAQNTTEAKRGFSVRIFSLARVQARENTTLQIATRNVPTAFHKLLEAAGAAGGPVLTSQLNEQDANNMTGQLVFELARDKWPAVDTALKEAGLLISRSVVRSPDVENSVDSKIRLTISLLDEIRLAPRETINAKLATATVAETFATLLTAANEAGARVVASNLNLNDRTRPTGELRFVVAREKASQVEQALRQAGLLQSRTIARLPDGPMTVESKVGFVLDVIDERALRPRESHHLVVVTPGAADRYAKLLDALRLADAQVLNSQFSKQNKNDLTGTLDFIVRRENRDAIEKALSDGTDVFNRSVERLPDTQDAVDSKVQFHVVVKDAEQQQPRQVYNLVVETSDVEKAVGDLEAAAMASAGRKLDAQRSRDRGKESARVVVDVPLARAGEVINAARSAGEVTASETRRQDGVPEGSLSRAQIEISFTTPTAVRSEQGLGESLKQGLSGALTGLFTVLRWVVFGLVAVVPWVLIGWVLYRLTVGRRKRAVDRPIAPPSDAFGTTPNPT